MAKRKPTGPRLTVTKVFDWDKAEEAWSWRIEWPRRFAILATPHYKNQAGARAAGRIVARELGLAVK